MTASEYFDLVDNSGRMTRSDKPGAIDADLAPMLLRIGANPDAWLETVSRFGSKFRLAAGLVSNLRNFAAQLGRHWLQGAATARAAFASSPPQLARRHLHPAVRSSADLLLPAQSLSASFPAMSSSPPVTALPV